MANQKPKKSGKKENRPQPEAKKDVRETKEVKETVTTTTVAASGNPMKGFFARKYDANESIVTIFKTPKIWGALLGELIGTMLLAMFMLLLGVQPMYMWMCVLCIYAVIVGISGANLNPLVTVGMMASRRMSAIRGVLYMLAQLLGGWIGLIVVNAFRLGSGTATELPAMQAVAGENFWAVALVELLGAIVIAFCFARAFRYARKSPLTFAFIVASALTLAVIFGLIISQNYFMMSDSFIFNPVIALMYQILPSTADGFGELAQLAGLAVAAYILVPMLGGVIGFYLSDVTTRLSCGGYFCDEDAVATKK